jgi:hypothetical protein
MIRMNLPLLLIGMLGVQPSAQAGFDWDFTNPNVTSDAASFSGTNITASASAFSTNLPGAAGYGNGSAGTVFAAATASPYSGGIGINNADEAANVSPDHAVDNVRGIDALLYTFTDASNPATKIPVTLNSVTIGWKGTDADISILAYTGTGAPTMIGNTIAELLANSWTFIGHYANLALNTAKTINTGNISSSYWLVSAYSNAYGSSSGISYLNSGNDYFKISGLGASSAQPPSGGDPVPEPSSLALLAFGLLYWRFSTGSNQSRALENSLGSV